MLLQGPVDRLWHNRDLTMRLEGVNTIDRVECLHGSARLGGEGCPSYDELRELSITSASRKSTYRGHVVIGCPSKIMNRPSIWCLPSKPGGPKNRGCHGPIIEMICLELSRAFDGNIDSCTPIVCIPLVARFQHLSNLREAAPLFPKASQLLRHLRFVASQIQGNLGNAR